MRDALPLGAIDVTREAAEQAERARVNGHAPEWQAPDPAFFSVQSWLERDIPEPDMLLGPFSTTSRGLFVADTGLGKTNFAMALAFAMAAGQPFLHWQNQRPAHVVFIDGEMSRRLLRNRIRDAVRRCGAVPDGLFFVSKDDLEEMPPLNQESGQQFVDALINRFGTVDFTYFDNIQSLLLGDMKDEVPWQETLPWIRNLTRRSIGQLWIHHTGHETGRAYGTKTREWQLDTVILAEVVERPDTDIAFNLKFTKARERTPDNRADFDSVIVTLANDRWDVEGAAPKKAKPPSPLGQKFHSALLDAICNTPIISPQSAGKAATTTKAWAVECIRLGLLSGDADKRAQHSNRSMLSKYRSELIAADWMACNGDLAWSIR